MRVAVWRDEYRLALVPSEVPNDLGTHTADLERVQAERRAREERLEYQP
jgi:hypothetical protein